MYESFSVSNVFLRASLASYSRGVAQSGSVPALGAGGRKFKSSRPDHYRIHYENIWAIFFWWIFFWPWKLWGWASFLGGGIGVLRGSWRFLEETLGNKMDAR